MLVLLPSCIVHFLLLKSFMPSQKHACGQNAARCSRLLPPKLRIDAAYQLLRRLPSTPFLQVNVVIIPSLSVLQDPLKKVADFIASHTRVLCLDELFVNDVADAVILYRLFSHLFDRGLVLVATSNRRPDKLYENGLQRQLFVPFIQRLEKECIVHDMDSATDYRQLATRTVGVYFVRLVDGATNDNRLSSALKAVRNLPFKRLFA
jgi:predicted ATPase